MGFRYMNHKIRKANHTDIDRLAVSLARAFDDDPFISWLVRKDKMKQYRMERLFHVCISELCLKYEKVFTTEDFTGVTLWYPPGTSEISFASQLLLAGKMIPVVGFTGLFPLAMALDNMSKKHPPKKYYYLQFIGVVPEHQGKGQGASLMKPILDICDNEHCGAYLECSKETNIDFYKRFGFRVVEKFFPHKKSPPLWLMWRNPNKPSSFVAPKEKGDLDNEIHTVFFYA